MLKTILSAVCASALLAGAAYAQSASSPQDSTVQDPARMQKPGWTNESGAKTQPYPSKSGTPSGFDKAEQKAMEGVSGDKAMSRDRKMSKTRSTTGAAAGSSTRATFPECSDAGAPEEVTRCLNREMAQALERGVGANEIIKR